MLSKVCAMTCRLCAPLIASLSVVALVLASNETFARSGAAPHGGFASRHSISHSPVARSLRHHRRFDQAIFWPWVGDDFSYGPSTAEPPAGLNQPLPGGGLQSTCTYDIPWDWIHRCPPVAASSERPSAPNCPSEAVTVLGRDGKEQTVNVIRCY